MTIRRIALAILTSILSLTGNGRAEELVFEGVPYRLQRIDSQKETLRLFWKDDAGVPFRQFRTLEADLNRKGQQLKFVTNGGIYEPGFIPSGLHIEEGETLHPLNLNPPPPELANFYLMPNGVFYIDAKSGPGVLSTEAYAGSGLKPQTALQSGPMLLIDGKIHPAFRAGSDSLKRRSGIGVDSKGHIIILSTIYGSLGDINFHTFARLFQQHDCRNALFLDGDISRFYVRGEDSTIPKTTDFAALLGVVEEG